MPRSVTCSGCGKSVQGRVGPVPGFYVTKHKRTDGKPCNGHLRHDHQEKRP